MFGYEFMRTLLWNLTIYAEIKLLFIQNFQRQKPGELIAQFNVILVDVDLV